MNDWDLERYLEEPDTEEGTEGETLEQVQEMNLHDYIYRHRHWITQMVGGREMEPVTGTLALQTGDRVLLTSDGIHDNLTRTEIEEILKSKTKDPARAIVEAARTRSLDNEHLRAKPDDMSAVVLDVKK